ncbi:MAG: Ig-like domain-containing protein, partial [Propionibacteriaceae bacterium]|nr:Ig-like domain-containing protein [Propionibacteriaceae bacterium]
MGHSIITPQAHAAATVGTFPMSGWYTDTTSGALEVTNPMISLSDQVLAGSSNSSSTSISGQTTTGGWIGTYSTDGTPPTTPDAHVFTNGNGSTNLTTGDGIGNEFSTLALDANMNGHASSPSMYFWSWNGDTENNATTLANLESVMGQTRPSDYIQPIFRLTPGSTIPEVSVIPTARYFADEAGYPLLDTVWSGGEVIQKTGEVFISGAECDNLDGAYRMMIWNPTTGAYNYSGQILPLSPDDDIFNGPLSTLYGCGADGTVASDMALDGDGNAYILVESTQPVPSMGFTTTMMRIWLVRVVPSSTGDWTYNLVTPLTAAPSEPIGSQAQAFAGTSTLAATQTGTYGMAFFQGTLYATNTGVNSLLAINPMSGYVTSIPPGTLDTLFNTGDPTYVYDLASGQTAYTIAGTIYNDSNLNGVQDATEIGVSGQTVALYMKDPISGDYTLEGIRKTDADGTYSFLVGGQGTYIVRLVQPMLDGVNAVQTGATGGGTLNPVVAQCGATTVTTAAGGPCDGAIPMPTAAPPLPTDPAAVGTDTSTQPDTMPFYSTVTITSDEEVATADFGIALNTSYGDSPIGPIDVASGAPVHNNGADPQIWLGATLGSYDAPATNDSHTASDDGVFISTFAGPLPLGSNTVISATYPYDMYADVSGPQADSGYVNAWVTTPIISPNTWSSTPQWSPTVSNGVAASTFQFATSASLGAGQPAYMRVDASTVDETSATNLGFGYQSDATGTPYWATPGEIEDYSLTVANSVYRPAVKTSGPSASFVIASSTDTQTLAGSSTLNVGKPDGVAGGSAIPITATAPDDTWAVTAVTVKDTTSGTVLSSPSFTTTGLVTSFSYTPAAGTDAVVEVDYARIPDTTNSQLTLDPNPQTVGQDMAASALIEDADGTPLAGVTVTFAVSDPDLSLDDTTCTTASDGTCGVNVTSTVAGTYTNALTAQVSIDGTLTDITGSPASPEFDHGTLSTTASTFTVTPVATTSDSTTWVPVSDGTDYYTGVLTAKDSDGNLIDDLTPLSDIVFSSSSSDVTVTSVTNTGNGTYSVQFSSEVADATPTASVTYQSTQVGTDLPIPFVAGTPDPGPITCTDPSKTGTNVSASPTELPVDEDSTITALITDEYCNPVSGVPVTFTAVTPTSGVVTVVTGTTGDDGIATATVTDSVDESVDVDVTITQGTVYGSPVSVLFDPGALSYTRSTFAVTPVANTADSSTWVPVSDGTGTDYYTGVLTALDTDGNPLDSLALTDISFTASSTDVTVTSVTNTGNGTYSVQFSSEVADATPTASVTYKSTQVGTSLPIPFVAGDPVPGPVTCTDSSKTGSNFSVSDNEVTAGDPVTVTAYITDEYCNPVDNATVDFSLDTGSDALLSDSSVSTGPDGVASTTLNDATAETVTVNATLGTDAVYGSPQDVTFDAGSFSYTESTFTVTPVADTSDSTTWVAASDGTGTDYYTGVLTAKDGEGNLLDSLTLSDIAFAASSSDVTVTSVTNTGNGTYSVRFSSEVADATPTASVTYQTTQVGTDLPIPFVAGTPDPGPVTCSDPTKTGTNVAASPTELAVDDDSTITALITDEYCNPVSGVPVTFDVVTPTSGVITTVTGTTGDDGIATATLTDAVAETVQATATITQGTVYGSPVSVTFDAGLFSYSKSTFTVTPVADTSDTTTWVPVSDGTGTDYYTGVLTAKDSDGNLLDSLTLSDIAFAASSSDVTVTSVTNTGNGTYSVQFSSEVADATPTASVTYQTTQVGTDLPIPFVAGTPDPGPVTCSDPTKTGTNVTASPTELAVDDDSTITALITDEYCNPVSGATVTFGVVVPTSGVITTVIGTTGDDGIATATLTDAVAETVQATATITQGTVNGSPVSVTFDAGLFSYTKSTFTVTPVADTSDSTTWVPVSDGTGTDYYTGVLTAKDSDGNLLDSLTLSDIAFAASSSDVTVTSVTNTGNGTYSVQFSSEVADATPTASVTYQTTQVGTDLPIPFVAGTPDPGPVTCSDPTKTGTNVTASPTELAVDDDSTITALITDEYCNPVSGATVTFGVVVPTSGVITTVIGTTGDDGIATATLTDAVAETVQATATITQGTVNGSPVSVTFDSGLFSYSKSTFTVTPVADTSDNTTWVPVSDGTGTDYYTGVLTAKDSDGNLLDSLTLSDIAFAASSSDVTVTSVTNTGNGTYSVQFSSEVADATPTASVTYQTTQVGTDLPIPFVAGTPDPGPVTCSDPTKTGTNVAASPTELAVDDDSTITALITDEYCNPVSGVPVTFDVVTPTSGVITTVIGTTGDDGIATATLTDAVAETVQATATITQGTVNGSPVSVTFDSGLFSYSKSTFTVTPVADTSDSTTWVPVSDGTGTDYYTGVLTAKDSDGNLLDSLTLSDIAFASSSSDVTVTSVTNTGNGTYSVQFSSEVADATPTASVTYQTTQVGTDLPIPFVAGTPDPGPVTCSDPTKTGTNVAASPTELAVDDDSTITALITDEYCNPVSGATVTFGVVVPTSGVITTVIGTTGDDGIATATLTDAVAETVQATATITQGTVNGSPVSVTFDTGLFSYSKSTFTVTPVADISDTTTWVPASDGTGTDYYTGVLTAKDSDGNLLDSLTLSDIAFASSSSDVTVTSVTNTGNGTYSVQFSSEVADATPTASVTYQTTQVGTDLPIPFVAGTPDPGPVTCSDPTKTGTNVTASPTELAVDDDSTITALITDEYCNPVSGVPVTFDVVTPTSGVITTVIGTTGDDGIATATLTDAVAETVQATATITQGTVNGSPVSVVFDTGLFSYTKSTFTVTPVADTSDTTTWVPVSDGTGTDYYTGVLTAKDSDGNLLDSLTLSDIAFAASSTDVTVTAVTNTGNGTYSVQFSSEVADATPTASVTYQTTQVGTDLPIPFVAGTPDPGPVTCSDPTKTGTNVSASPTEVAVDDNSTITALITDQYCNPVSGAVVSFAVVSNNSGVVTTVIGTTGADGIATATLTDAVAETVIASASISQGPVYGSPVSVVFDAGLFSYSKSTFTVTPVADTSDTTTWVPVSDGTGTDYYTGVLTAKDSDGNLLDSLTLSDIAFGSSSSDVTVTSVTNTGNGTYSVQYSSQVADATPTANVTYKTTQVGTDLPIPFVAGTPDPGPVTCSDPTKTGTNVTASPTEVAVDDDSTITALITDQYCNPVSGVPVTFDVVTPTSGVITTVIGTTGDDGIATATLTD